MQIETIAASPEGLRGIASFRAMLAGQSDDADTDLAVRRARLIAFAASAPKPAGVTITEEFQAGVRLLSIAPPDWSGEILYLHGGAYVLGSADTHARLAAAYAPASGARIWSVDYRLAPEHPYPAALDDGVAAWRSLAGDLPAAIIGDSAGGGLALALAQRIRDESLSAPVGLALVSPWADLTLTAPAITERADREIMLSQRGLALDADRYRGDIPASDPRISPLLGNMEDLPPTFIQIGTEEILYDDAVRLAERIDAAGAQAHLQIWQGMAHAWPAFGDAVPEAAASVQAVAQFCRDRLTKRG